ncbi:hypothetical protein GXP67_02130 [Rhodocytophaga rosea]|uniref:Uncharacterized protein n=1 Tax=Rhodocytophaga rosea TaxID=2704465 RepID=A0A6C0GCC6_9BACT|nr:hypothetical protein [Rhodocytophaga rosea]QHT65547.1 hypothetical protein GXP67_02130 [Rhodocytophaga rosea]
MFAKLKFRNLLMYMANLRFTDPQVQSMNEQFRTALLDFASETPDNLASVDNIEIGKIRVNGRLESGLKIKGKKIMLSELMHSIEEMDLPEEIKAEYPKLTQEEWAAATRIMTLILSSLEDDFRKLTVKLILLFFLYFPK